MLAIELRKDAHVRTLLAIKFIAQNAQRFEQLLGANVARDFHEANSSSRTK